LSKCEQFIKEKTNYTISLKVEPMETNIEFQKEDGAMIDKPDDDYAAKVFCQCMRDKIKVIDENIWVFDERTGIWTDKETAIKYNINKFRKELTFEYVNDLGEVSKINYGGMKKNIANMLSFVSKCAKNDDLFFENNIDSSM
jgi:hypothetical protein